MGGWAAFLRSSAAAIVSGAAHHDSGPPPPLWWRLTMGVSCLAYVLPALVWRAAGRGDMAGLFALVALLSTLADAVRLDVDLVRTCDRAVGALALTSSCVINSTTPLNATLCLAAVVSSLWWLRAGRAVRWRGSAAAHRGQGRYLLYHATWHWWGAACVCAVTAKVQLRQDVPGD